MTQKLFQSGLGAPRRNALTPVEDQTSRRAPGHDEAQLHQVRPVSSVYSDDKEPPKPLPHPGTPIRPPRPDGRAPNNQPRHGLLLFPGNADKEPPKPLPHPGAPARPPRPDAPSNATPAAECLDRWPAICDVLAKKEIDERLRRNYLQLKADMAQKILNADTKELVGVVRAYCDINPILRQQDDEDVLSILTKKLTSKGIVQALWREESFQGIINDKRYAKVVVYLFASAIIGEVTEVDAAGGDGE